MILKLNEIIKCILKWSIRKGVTIFLFLLMKGSKILAYYRDSILCLIWRNVWPSIEISRHQLYTQNYLQTLDVLLRHQANHTRCESRHAISNSHLHIHNFLPVGELKNSWNSFERLTLELYSWTFLKTRR